jgi:pimeloyl-ACP methyl ester carboxylesterase
MENGNGAPLLYLHGFADVHSVKESWLPFHQQLAKSARVIAPAHPGCAQSDEDKDIDTIEDVVFAYLADAIRPCRNLRRRLDRRRDRCASSGKDSQVGLDRRYGLIHRRRTYRRRFHERPT